MAKVKVTKESDGETSGIKKAGKTVESFNVRLDAFAGKEDLNPEECPENMVPMLCGKNTRVSCLSGNVYCFAANKILFVQTRDQDVCAGKGAVLQDAAAIKLRKQAEADAIELAELRAEKEKKEADKAAADLAKAKAKAK